jgi:ABC-type oligopeptide transport system substrate-binding subunit
MATLLPPMMWSYQYQADPTHAWDFTWFWSDIVNFDEAVAGSVPLTDIGVQKVDDYTVTFTTEDSSPYFPSKALYIRPTSKAAFEKYGEYYNNTPEHPLLQPVDSHRMDQGQTI